ncbi:hypothetical protein FA10DRAFT_279632 [Acaromyces ingoldii]|uniref:Uncharacterized protein n=1 Tax=Acaromyces ingoldii TaxID=215250 RepID=A0A316YLU4_9BASI|nr:hypothetical protein FA10DRAFT_279632 [Acaromyces ingoldii]PWN90520.1 hypothetical protein FA10DRAFT_279632 [Acaromyces ingoldii]
MKEPTDQGQIRVPLPSPLWPMAWRSVFNREMTNQLKTKLLKEGQDLKQFDAELGAEKNGALQIAQKAQTKWWTTTPEYRGEDRNKKLRQLFEVNNQAKECFPRKYTNEVMLYPVEAAQQGTGCHGAPSNRPKHALKHALRYKFHSRTFQFPPKKGNEASPSEQPKKYLRLFGKNLEPHKPDVAAPAGSASPARPVSDFQCNPTTGQGYPINPLWFEHGSSGTYHAPCQPYLSNLENAHHEQGSGSSLYPPDASPPWLNVLSSSSSSPQSSPERARGSPTFMRDARRAGQERSQYQQDMMTRPRRPRNRAAAQEWDERKREMEEKYLKSGIPADSTGLELLEAQIGSWDISLDDAVRNAAFKGASEGQHGTMRLGMKTSTDQGELHMPLACPEWPMEWRKTFNTHMARQLIGTLEDRRIDLEEFDPAYSRGSRNIRQIIQFGHNRWWTTTPGYNGPDRNERLRRLFEINKQAKNGFPSSYREALYPEEAAQQDSPRAPDIILIISNRFIPPDDTGLTVYRTLPGDKEG